MQRLLSGAHYTTEKEINELLESGEWVIVPGTIVVTPNNHKTHTELFLSAVLQFTGGDEEGDDE